MMPLPSTAELSVRVNEHEKRLDSHVEVHEELWGAINHLRNRLPLWATLLIGLLASVAGASLTLAGDILIRMAF
jgi:hypothetical protein